MQNAAQFAIQSELSDALKGFVVMKVDEFRKVGHNDLTYRAPRAGCRSGAVSP